MKPASVKPAKSTLMELFILYTLEFCPTFSGCSNFMSLSTAGCPSLKTVLLSEAASGKE